ncbi:MAG: hypothetical protein GY714_15580 [Desulfobacterales bacterium]|nr:hypothetical protein [Desulfobacterales bacterium]
MNQEKVDKILSLFLGNMKKSNSFLFSGPEGTGKSQKSINYAMAVNCSNNSISSKAEQFCGICKSCIKIKSSNHPDIITLKPTDNLIKIDKIRDLLKIVSLKPYEAKYRFIIIQNADLMNIEASNALLKSLEEPPSNTMFILTTSREQNLIDTVLSRCFIIKFKPIDIVNFSECLTKEHGIDEKDSYILAVLSGCDLEKSLKMKRDGWIIKRDWIIDQIINLEVYISRDLILLAEKISNNKIHVVLFIKIIISIYRDVEIYKNCSELIVNKDKINYINQLSLELSSDLVYKRYEIALEAEKALKSNMNLKLLIENMVFRLAEK